MPYYGGMKQRLIKLFLFPLRPYLIQVFLIFICGVLVSACSLPLAPKVKEGCIYEEVDCRDKCGDSRLDQELNDLRCQVECGHLYAAVCLGHMYLTGDRVPKDTNRAFCWYKKAAEGGIPIAQVQMGHFYRDGCILMRDTCEALIWYQKAADQGDVTAMLALGEMYKGWHGMRPDYKKALCWYENAAACGSVDAEYEVAVLISRGTLDKNIMCEGVEKLSALAAVGHPDAMAALGDVYYEGRLVAARDLQRAYEYYCSAAKLGSAEAAFKIGMLFASGQCVDKNPLEAAKWMGYAAERGMSEAQMYLGNLYREGRGIPKSYKTAAYWYAKAAEQGFMGAHTELGDLYLAGKGVPRYLEKAAAHYSLAADCGNNPYAALILSILYEDGRGVAQDFNKSVAYYQLAKRQSGFHLAEYKVGRRYATGFGFTRSVPEAMQWYLRAAKAGLTIAQTELGDLYYSGECVAQDFGKAEQWYRKAATRGHTYAQNMLGLILLEGDCLPKYAKTVVPGFKAAGEMTPLPCNPGTGCLCEPAYSERPNGPCNICALTPECRQLEVQCLRCSKTTCNCGPRYAFRTAPWCNKGCSAKHPFCAATIGRCKVAVSAHNARQAANWIQKAAIGGAGQAQFQLGVLYIEGIGVPKDEVKAYAWLSTAVEGMDDKVPDVLRCLFDKMSPELRCKAVCLADKYKCRYRKNVPAPTRY